MVDGTKVADGAKVAGEVKVTNSAKAVSGVTVADEADAAPPATPAHAASPAPTAPTAPPAHASTPATSAHAATPASPAHASTPSTPSTPASSASSAHAATRATPGSAASPESAESAGPARGEGLRERKKRETRELISDRATALFIERGFEVTTVAEIADAAGVAKKTVTNYFPRKEDMALDHHEEYTSGLARTVEERARGESALAALRRAFLAAVARHDPVIGFSGEPFARMIAESPTLVARLRDLHEQREDALATALATATRAAPGDITPRAVAAQLAGTHRVLFRLLMEMTWEGTPNSRMAEVLSVAGTRAFMLLERSLGGYAVREEHPSDGADPADPADPEN